MLHDEPYPQVPRNARGQAPLIGQALPPPWMECPSRVVFPWGGSSAARRDFPKTFYSRRWGQYSFSSPCPRYAEFQYRRSECSQPRRQRTPPGTDGPWKRRRYPRCHREQRIGPVERQNLPVQTGIQIGFR